MERQEGYYWVKLKRTSEPRLAYYIKSIGVFEFNFKPINEEDFYWIDLPENRLTPPNI